MIGRGPLTTYEAVETNSNRVVIIKALQKNEENAALLKEIEGLKNCDSKYVLKYYGFYEKGNEYWVMNQVACKALVHYGEMGTEIPQAMLTFERCTEGKRIERDCQLLPNGA